MTPIHEKQKQVLTVQHRRGEISGQVTQKLSERLRAKDSSFWDEDMDSLSKTLGMNDHDRKVLSGVRRENDGRPWLVKRGGYDEYRKSVRSIFKGWRVPIWSRWLTFGKAVCLLLVGLAFELGNMAGRLWGSHIQIKETKAENFLGGHREGGSRLVFIVCYFIALLVRPCDKFRATVFARDRFNPVGRLEGCMLFEEWHAEMESELRDVQRTTKSLEIILGKELDAAEKAKAQ